jgi:hypothetical protein
MKTATGTTVISNGRIVDGTGSRFITVMQGGIKKAGRLA